MILAIINLEFGANSINRQHQSEARRDGIENIQRSEWLKHKGMDPFDAMQLYMDKVKELAQIYEAPASPDPEASKASD